MVRIFHMTRKIFSSTLIVFSLFLVTVVPTFAWEQTLKDSTSFPSCLNPQISPSQVNKGSNHGVVGFSTPFSGTDTIFNLSRNNVLQCLCTDNGQGFQTNWLNVSQLSQSEINVFVSQGWTFFANAGAWGLNGAYVAKTSQFLCSAPTTTPTPTPGQVSSSNTNPTATPIPQATNTPTPKKPEVLALATTGNILFIYILLLAGGSSFILGLILRKLSK